MKLIGGLIAVLAVLAIACGGDDNDNGNGIGESGNGTASIVIPAADADRVARQALPVLTDLPGEGWRIVAEDDFGDDSSDEFLAMLEGTPECETLENLTTLGTIFGDGEEAEDEPMGRAQVEFQKQDLDAFIPTAVEVDVEVKESAAGSRAQFQLVKELVESSDTAQCLVTVLNRQFTETGPAGVSVEVRQGANQADTPQDGARMAFDLDIAILGIEVAMAMEMYFWPYGNASVRVLFVGTNEMITADLVRGVLTTVDENLQAAVHP